jgi:AGCS family alanine or glycine:cation symporter
MEALNNFLGNVSSFLWGIPLLILIVGTGIYLTVRVGFLQIRLLPTALRLVFSKKHLLLRLLQQSEQEIS